MSDERLQIPVPEAGAMYALLGHPVAHSMSPAMHNEAFKKLGFDAKYVAIDVTEEQLPEALLQLKDMGYRGWNLTMPLKSAIVPYMDEVSREARLCGAVNTVKAMGDGRLYGHTTDGIGYLDSLREVTSQGIEDKVITILGCGGAARSIISAAALSGARAVHVVKRKNASFDEAVASCWQVQGESGTRVDVIDMGNDTDFRWAVDDCDILTNATNVGMEGEDMSSPVPADYLREDMIVSDIIYHPEVTRLLSDARSAGAVTHGGRGMLLYQGAAAFKLWTEHDMPVGYIKETVFK